MVVPIFCHLLLPNTRRSLVTQHENALSLPRTTDLIVIVSPHGWCDKRDQMPHPLHKSADSEVRVPKYAIMFTGGLLCLSLRAAGERAFASCHTMAVWTAFFDTYAPD